MTETVMTSSIDQLAPAILAAKKKMTNAVKDAKNPFFKSKFADLNSVREASEPALAEEGISVLQPMVQKDGKTYIRTMLLHTSGQFLASDTEVVCAKQNDPQAYGSAISYARRYGLQALVSLGAEDNDGEEAMGRGKASAWPKNEKVPVDFSPIAATLGEQKVPAATELKTTSSSSFRKPKAPVQAETKAPTTEEGWS